MIKYKLVIIGAGPAGMAASISAIENGVESVLLIDRNASLGGVLNQCIHDGFGLEIFHESLTGPEYAGRYAQMISGKGIKVLLNAMVSKVTPELDIHITTREGVKVISAKALVLATGCRERTRGMLSLPGTRPSGIYTAGVVQKLINIQGIRPGNKVVILGSGDVGMIMARRMTLEGMNVVCVLEKLPYLSGLLRNKHQCLDDFSIPLLLSHTITDIQGTNRLECVVVAKINEDGSIMNGSEYVVECDTLVLSVGLIPENELAISCGIDIDRSTGGPKVNGNLETSINGIFSAGNSLHVHSLVDNASREGALAGYYAACSLR